MKKYYLFIALAMVAAMTVSCKNNNKKAKEAAEATAEVVEAAKTILADDVQVWDAVNAGGEISTHFSQETLEHSKNFFAENVSVYTARRANLLK